MSQLALVLADLQLLRAQETLAVAVGAGAVAEAGREAGCSSRGSEQEEVVDGVALVSPAGSGTQAEGQGRGRDAPPGPAAAPPFPGGPGLAQLLDAVSRHSSRFSSLAVAELRLGDVPALMLTYGGLVAAQAGSGRV